MKRFLPNSLSGQIALVMTMALLAASAVNFALLMSERARAGLIETTGPGMARFVDLTAEMTANPPTPRQAAFGRGGARFSVTPRSQIAVRGLARNDRLESRLAAAFELSGVVPPDLAVATMTIERADWFERPNRFERPRLGSLPGERPFANDGPARDPRAIRRGREIVMAAALPDGRWLNASFFSPEPPRGEIFRLGAGTFVLFASVLAASLWIASRLSRPLKDLTSAAARVGSATEPEEVLVRGPSDVRQTLEAFNAMSQRVSQLLNEKDVMLGALGHDLRTPLSSLRIRIESMEPESERLKAVRTIEEAARLLDDILELARRGRSSEPEVTIDMAVLVEDMVEDYAETGAAVTLASKEKAPAACRPILFRRMLRNLIDNALLYGGSASVSTVIEGESVVIQIADEGPGIPEAALLTATQPFVRGEDSRSRSTGGAGLGLALADAIARAHGGALTLENRASKGLVASIRLPLANLVAG